MLKLLCNMIYSGAVLCVRVNYWSVSSSEATAEEPPTLKLNLKAAGAFSSRYEPRKKIKCQKTPIFTNLKKRFEYKELPAKLLEYFLRSSKRNINL